MKHLLWSAAFIVTVTIPIAVAAEDGTPDVVKERKELMQVMAREMDEIANRIVAKRDLAAIGENAMRVRNAGARSLQLFPAGSDAGLTEAKPTIWQRWDQFETKTQKLVQAAEALENIAASEDPRAITVQYVVVRRACGECHVLFRQQSRQRSFLE
jgi:cytochrome c556